MEFLREVRGDSKLDLLEKCHVMLLASSADEGLPNAILEGMLYGLTILSTPVVAIPEHVSSGISRFLVENADMELLAENLQEFACNMELNINISATNHSKASIAYSTARVKRDF